MPLTSKGKKIEHAMEKEYGEKKGKQVFYASANKGTIKGVEEKKKKMANKMKADIRAATLLARKKNPDHSRGWRIANDPEEARNM